MVLGVAGVGDGVVVLMSVVSSSSWKVVLMFGSLRNLLFAPSRKSVSSVVEVAPVGPVLVSREVMDAAFDRSAGRFCGVCDAHGSHHTDKHDEFARAALAKAGL